MSVESSSRVDFLILFIVVVVAAVWILDSDYISSSLSLSLSGASPSQPCFTVRYKSLKGSYLETHYDY